MFVSSPERAAVVEALVDHLAAVPVGSIASYEGIHEATGLVVGEQRDLLYRALRHLNETTGAVFANVQGKGYQRMEPEKVHTVGIAARASIRGKAKRNVRRLVNAASKSNSLDPQTNARISAEVGVLGIIGRAAEDRTVDKLVSLGPVPVESMSLSKFVDFVRGA